MRYVLGGVALAVIGLVVWGSLSSGDGVRPLLQSYYDAELARVRLDARIAQAEIDALRDPLAE